MSLSALHGRDEKADVAIVRQRPGREIKFAQRGLVICLLIIEVQSESEMAFAEVRLDSQGLLRFGARFFFPRLGGLKPMIDAADDG